MENQQSKPDSCPADGLAGMKCEPCRGGVQPLKGGPLADLLANLDGWRAVDEHHLAKSYKFRDFASALAMVNRIGATAEEQGHHPRLVLSWGRVDVEIYTHKIDGLTESDFILAAKIDRL